MLLFVDDVTRLLLKACMHIHIHTLLDFYKHDTIHRFSVTELVAFFLFFVETLSTNYSVNDFVSFADSDPTFTLPVQIVVQVYILLYVLLNM